MKKLFVVLYSFILCVGFVGVVSAADYAPLAPLPGITGETQASGTADLPTYLRSVYNFGIGLAAVLAVMMIMWGGIEYMTTDAIGHKEEGKERIQSAVLGLLLALSSYIILKTVNKDLLNLDFGIEGIPIPPGAAIGGQAGQTGIGVFTGDSVINPDGVNEWGDPTAKDMEGQEINARFTYYSSTEAGSDTNTANGLNAVGGRLVVGGEDPTVVGSAASNFYPPGTIISRNIGGQKYYYVVDDNNIGAGNNNLNNNHTFDIYNNQSNPGAGNPDNGQVTIEHVPDHKLTNQEVNDLHDINNVSNTLGD